MNRAICVRCAASRGDYDQVCPSCGFVAQEEGLLVAWLLSSHHLSEHALEDVERRIRAGDSIDPSDAMLKTARRALRRDFTTDPGLSGVERLAVLATSLVATPAVGLVLWWTWRTSRPRAAWQAFALSAPASVAFAVLGIFVF